MGGERVPERPDPVEPPDGSWRVLVWTTVATNFLLGLFAFAGWLGRPRSCLDGCSWRPIGGMLWVLLVVIDVGLVLVWAGIGYLRLQAVGERIGRRISGRRDGDTDA
jgi:hypothetical protein